MVLEIGKTGRKIFRSYGNMRVLEAPLFTTWYNLWEITPGMDS